MSTRILWRNERVKRHCQIAHMLRIAPPSGSRELRLVPEETHRTYSDGQDCLRVCMSARERVPLNSVVVFCRGFSRVPLGVGMTPRLSFKIPLSYVKTLSMACFHPSTCKSNPCVESVRRKRAMTHYCRAKGPQPYQLYRDVHTNQAHSYI
jgi:hypothetical protein